MQIFLICFGQVRIKGLKVFRFEFTIFDGFQHNLHDNVLNESPIIWQVKLLERGGLGQSFLEFYNTESLVFAAISH